MDFKNNFLLRNPVNPNSETDLYGQIATAFRNYSSSFLLLLKGPFSNEMEPLVAMSLFVGKLIPNAACNEGVLWGD